MSSINNLMQQGLSQGSTPGGGESQGSDNETADRNVEVSKEGGTIKEAVLDPVQSKEGGTIKEAVLDSVHSNGEVHNLEAAKNVAVRELLIEAIGKGVTEAPSTTSEAATLDGLGSILKDTFDVAIEEVLKEFNHKREELDIGNAHRALQGHSQGMETKFLEVYKSIRQTREVKTILLARFNDAHRLIRSDVERLFENTSIKISEMEKELPIELFITIIQELLSSAYKSKIMDSFSSSELNNSAEIIELPLQEDMPDTPADHKIVKDLYEWALLCIKGSQATWPGDSRTAGELNKIILQHQVIPERLLIEGKKPVVSWTTQNQKTERISMLPFNRKIVIIYIATATALIPTATAHPALSSFITLNKFIFPSNRIDNKHKFLWVDALSTTQHLDPHLNINTLPEEIKRPISHSLSFKRWTIHCLDPWSISHIHKACNKFMIERKLQRENSIRERLDQSPVRNTPATSGPQSPPSPQSPTSSPNKSSSRSRKVNRLEKRKREATSTATDNKGGEATKSSTTTSASSSN